MNAVVEANSLTKRFGGLTAVRGASLAIGSSSIVGLIGPNGSGKTTTLNLLNGVYSPDSGVIKVGGRVLSGASSSAFIEAGIARTFQAPRVFSTLTLAENMLVPVLHRRGGARAWQARVDELLGFVGLAAHKHTPASELSGGQQKLLEFVRALMTDPHLVLMDEPFAGVHPSVKELMRTRIRECNERGTSFLIVSHEIPDLTRLCSRIICMGAGAVVTEGSPEEVTSHPEVIEAYLGRPLDAVDGSEE